MPSGGGERGGEEGEARRQRGLGFPLGRHAGATRVGGRGNPGIS
jgi:hypothetical protein